MRNLTTVRLAEGNTGWINAHSARWCIRAAHSFRSPCRCETTLHARLRYISVCVESRSTRHTGARPPVKAMQLGPRARASLGVAARACRQRTKRRRTSAGARSAPARQAALRRSSSRCRSSATAPAAPRACAAFVPPRQLPQLHRDQLTMVLGHHARPQRPRSAAAARGRSCGAPLPPGRPYGRYRRAGHEGPAVEAARRPERAPGQRRATFRR